MDLFNAINKGTIAIQEEFLPNFKILAEKIHNFKYKPAYQPSGFPYGNRYQAYPCFDSDKLENIDKKENKIILNTFNDTIGKPINNFFCRARYIVSKELANSKVNTLFGIIHTDETEYAAVIYFDQTVSGGTAFFRNPMDKYPDIQIGAVPNRATIYKRRWHAPCHDFTFDKRYIIACFFNV